jgi:hypothetical protein
MNRTNALERGEASKSAAREDPLDSFTASRWRIALSALTRRTSIVATSPSRLLITGPIRVVDIPADGNGTKVISHQPMSQ